MFYTPKIDPAQEKHYQPISIALKLQQEEENQKKQQQLQQEQIKTNILRKKNYGKLVHETHKPKISAKLKNEVELNKKRYRSNHSVHVHSLS